MRPRFRLRKQYLHFNIQFWVGPHRIHLERDRSGLDVEVLFLGNYVDALIYRRRDLWDRVSAAATHDIADEEDERLLKTMLEDWQNSQVDIEVDPYAEPQKIVCTWDVNGREWRSEARVVDPTTLQTDRSFPCR